MNELYIQQVLDIEKQAQEIRENAGHEAQKLIVQAEQDAQAILEKARTEAEAEAHQIIENAQAQVDIERIQAEAEENIRQLKEIAASHLDQAIAFVLDQVAGVR